MLILLLVIIACFLLFGSEQTKEVILAIIGRFIILAIIAVLAQACGLI